MRRSGQKAGMTMVELLMVLGIIGALAAILIPGVTLALQYRANAEVANKFRVAMLAFEQYHAETGEHPPNNWGAAPPVMAGYHFPYYKIDWWTETTAIGGRWDWDEYSSVGAYISIANPTASQAQLQRLDRLLDDGDLETGKFQKGVHSGWPNDYSFIVEIY